MVSVDKLNDQPYHLDYILKQGGDDNPQCHCNQSPPPIQGKSVSLALQLIIWYIIGNVAKFHIVFSTMLPRLGLAFFPNHSLGSLIFCGPI